MVKRNYIQAAIILILGVAIFAYFQFRLPYHFFYQEQEQLFLMDCEYISSHYSWKEAGWLSRLVGDFLTQFYYYMYAGAAILTIVLLTLGDVTRRADEAINKLIKREPNMMMHISAFIVGVFMMVLGALFAANVNFRLSGLIFLIGAWCFVWLAAWLIRRCKWKVGCVLSIIAAPLFYWMFYVDMNGFNGVSESDFIKFEKTLAFDNEYYFGNYDKVIEMARNEGDQLTDEMSFYYCMALEKKGLLADELPRMKKPNLGTFIKIGPDSPRFTIRMIDELYFLIGDMTYTERAAMLSNTFSREGRSARKIKRLAEANVIKGDKAAAEKYLRMLKKTIAYKTWAENMEQHLASSTPTSETAPDQIRIGDDCYTILTQILDRDSTNTVALDYLLMSDMLAGQREVFVRDYEKYGPSENRTLQEVYNGSKE